MSLKFSYKIFALAVCSLICFIISFSQLNQGFSLSLFVFLLGIIFFVSLIFYVAIDYFHLSKLDDKLENYKKNQQCPNPVSFIFKKNNLKSLFEKVYSLLCRQQHYEKVSFNSHLLRDQILNNLTDPVIMLDQYDTISFINPAALVLINKKEADCLGRSIQAFVRNTLFFDLLQTCKSRLCIQKRIVPFSSFKKQEFEVTTIPITDEKARFEGVLFLFHDVSVYTMKVEGKLTSEALKI